jgi:deoxyxylulose-5-phosphate synthase
VRREKEIAPFKDFRNIRKGKCSVVIGAGPVMNHIIEINDQLCLDLEIWLIDQLPILSFSSDLLEIIKCNKKVIFVEEHYQSGGLGEMLTVFLHRNKLIAPSDLIYFNYLCVNGYISGNYGDQKWHLAENNLFGPNLKHTLIRMIEN